MQASRTLGGSRAVHRLARFASGLCAFALAPACHAQDAEGAFAVHGYGQASALKSVSAPGGKFQLDYDLSVLGVWRVRPDFRAWVQLARYRELNSTRLEWAFLDWDVSGSTTLRLGQTRVPMGLVNEARDVQTLRNSVSKPLLYDGAHGLVDEALRGVVVEHRHESADTGNLVAETYASGATIRDESSAVAARLVGGRVQWTPSSSWNIAASAYAGRQAAQAEEAAGWRSRRALVLSAKLHAMDWDLSAELGAGRSGEGTLRVGYLQGERDISPQHAVFARVESSDRQAAAGDARETAEQRTRLAAGVAWKPSPRWGCRLEAGSNRASPTIPHPPATAPRTRWNDLAVGVNFYL